MKKYSLIIFVFLLLSCFESDKKVRVGIQYKEDRKFDHKASSYNFKENMILKVELIKDYLNYLIFLEKIKQ